ncbi:MAG: peptidylprolyl isomerase [Propionivibrio sp.]
MSNTQHGCTSGGSCSCGGGAALAEPLPVIQAPRSEADAAQPLARVNGVALHTPGDRPDEDTLRQRACSELLRQAAIDAGVLDAADAPDPVPSEAASLAIEQLLERELVLPEPSEDSCRRYHAAHAARYSSGERLHAQHVLFAVTAGVDVVALRKRAETCLLDVRCHDGNDRNELFVKAANTLSNCPSGAEGGELGWLKAGDCAPEFARELFGHAEVGVLPRLVNSRFGFHVVEVLAREAGVAQPFEAVQGAVAMAMRQTTYVTALRQYLRQLAGQAEIVGVDIEATETPLVQ